MNGQVMSAVHIIAVPICAPAMEYVAMPDGSSSAAPVINPGPRTAKNRLTKFGLFCFWSAMPQFLFDLFACVGKDSAFTELAHQLGSK